MKEVFVPIFEIEEEKPGARRARCVAYLKCMRRIDQQTRMEKESREKADRIGGKVG